jgi:hypothetical protein
MVSSRKKAKGKARRAAKAEAEKARAIEVVEDAEDEAAAANQLQGSRRGQLQMKDARKSKNDNTRTASAKCHHGLVPSHRRQSHEEFLNTSHNVENCKRFLQRFVYEFDSDSAEFDSAAGNFLQAYHATKEKYGEVWNDPGKMKFVVSYLITCGTSKVLEGHTKIASKYASLVSCMNVLACTYISSLFSLTIQYITF